MNPNLAGQLNQKLRSEFAREFLKVHNFSMIKSAESIGHPNQLICVARHAEDMALYTIHVHFINDATKHYNVYAQLPVKETWAVAYYPQLDK